MPHYMLSVHSVEGQAREPMTEEEMRRTSGSAASSRR